MSASRSTTVAMSVYPSDGSPVLYRTIAAPARRPPEPRNSPKIGHFRPSNTGPSGAVKRAMKQGSGNRRLGGRAMKKLVGVVAIAGLMLLPGAAFAGSSTDAA